MKSKYLEDQIHTVPCLYLGFCLSKVFIHVPDLRGFHDIPDDEEPCSKFISYSDELIEFPTSDECSIIWCRTFLYALHNRHSSIGRNERFKFIHTMFELFARKSWWCDVDDDGFHSFYKGIQYLLNFFPSCSVYRSKIPPFLSIVFWEAILSSWHPRRTFSIQSSFALISPRRSIPVAYHFRRCEGRIP